MQDPLRRGIRSIQNFPAPVIAMVKGSVWGGAFELVMSCDMIFAAETSTFAMTPANLGVAYDIVGIRNLIRDSSLHVIKEMLFTAKPISAERAPRRRDGQPVAPSRGTRSCRPGNGRT